MSKSNIQVSVKEFLLRIDFDAFREYIKERKLLTCKNAPSIEELINDHLSSEMNAKDLDKLARIIYDNSTEDDATYYKEYEMYDEILAELANLKHEVVYSIVYDRPTNTKQFQHDKAVRVSRNRH